MLAELLQGEKFEEHGGVNVLPSPLDVDESNGVVEEGHDGLHVN